MWEGYDWQDEGGYRLEATELRFHLLGIGPYSSNFSEIRNAIPAWAADVTYDSVRMVALVGKTNGKGGQPRDLTKRRMEILAQNPELEADSAELKFRMVQGHFMAEGRRLLDEDKAAGWFDPELVDTDAVESV